MALVSGQISFHKNYDQELLVRKSMGVSFNPLGFKIVF